MKYSDIIAEGSAAFWADTPRVDNPYPYQSIQWWAWDIGWVEGRAERGKAEAVCTEGRQHV